MLKTGSVFVFLYGGNIPFVVSLCFASQRTPTACPCCAGSISTIGLRSFLLKVSGSSSLLSFCCTSLVSGFIILKTGPLVYSQTVQQLPLVFALKFQKAGIHETRLSACCSAAVKRSEPGTAFTSQRYFPYKFDIPAIQTVNNVPILPHFTRTRQRKKLRFG